jgi:(p)ppGpp synthase/HD superfamily hydrolase
MLPLYITKQELISQIPANLVQESTFLEAIELAQKTHEHESRDGDPYLESHIWPMTLQVYNRYKNHEYCLEAVITSLLHDTIESDRMITKEFLSERFGNAVAENVQVLSKTEAEDSNLQSQDEKYASNKSYLQRVADSGGLAILIKLEDRLANLRSFQEDVFIAKPAKYRRYLREAEELIIPLAQRFNKDGNILEDLEREIKRVKEIIK